MKKIVSIVASALVAALPAAAQNLNPEVQVTNDYETHMSDVHKAGTPMAIPDSLMQFSTVIDYSVFKTDYQGAYDFSPYAISMEPEAKPYEGSRLYLRAGAGYSFHPVVRAVFAPVPRGLFRNSEFLSFDGYSGRFSSLDGRANYLGRDFGLEAGANVRWNKETFDLGGEASYDGIFTADDALVSNYHRGTLAWNIHSNTDDVKVAYDFDADVHYAADFVSTMGRVGEFGYLVDGFISPELSGSLMLRIDVHSQGSWYGGGAFRPAVLNWAAPKAVFEWDNVNLSAGARLALSERFSIHPDVHVEWLPGGGRLCLYANIGGGQTLGDYSFYKSADHWFNAAYLTKFVPTVEKISASLGVRGKMLRHLQYDFSGGYRILDNAAVQALAVDAAGLYLPGVAFADYSQAWAKALLSWKSERLDVNLDAAYSYTDLEKSATFLSVPAFSMETSALYNWNRRAFAGMRCKVLSARESTLVKLPAFVDLGLYGEFVFARRMSVWIQLGNLLNQKLSYSPTHIAGGISFTAGICLKLQ